MEDLEFVLDFLDYSNLVKLFSHLPNHSRDRKSLLQTPLQRYSNISHTLSLIDLIFRYDDPKTRPIYHEFLWI